MLDTILIVALLSFLLYMLKEIIYKNGLSHIQLKENIELDENYNTISNLSYCRKYKEKEKDKKGDLFEWDNYNTIRQRNVRREIKANKAEKKEKCKKKEKRLKCKNEKLKKEINTISREEFIISLDKEINTILAELILIKKNNEIVINRITPELAKIKIENANKLIKMINKQSVSDIDRIYVKKELLIEYIDILSNFINHTTII